MSDEENPWILDLFLVTILSVFCLDVVVILICLSVIIDRLNKW